MTTSNRPIPPIETDSPGRVPLRLRMAEETGTDQLDGGWWPQSRDLAVELADLVDEFPAQFGRIKRAWVSPPDWEPAPRRLVVAAGSVKVDSFPHDTHLIRLQTSDGTVLQVLVVPPGFTDDQGAEALLAAATRGNAHAATDLLDRVTEYPDVDPEDRWTDDGGVWWGRGREAPSFRT